MVITPPQLHLIGIGCALWSATSATNVKRSGFGTFTIIES